MRNPWLTHVYRFKIKTLEIGSKLLRTSKKKLKEPISGQEFPLRWVKQQDAMSAYFKLAKSLYAFERFSSSTSLEPSILVPS